MYHFLVKIIVKESIVDVKLMQFLTLCYYHIEKAPNTNYLGN